MGPAPLSSLPKVFALAAIGGFVAGCSSDRSTSPTAPPDPAPPPSITSVAVEPGPGPLVTTVTVELDEAGAVGSTPKARTGSAGR